jgi:hypothetical protein
MNYRDLTTPSQPSRSDADFQAMAGRILRESHGLIDDARRKQTPHFIDVKGLSRTHLTTPGAFEHEFAIRVAWCKQYGLDFAIEPIGPNPEGTVGKRFRFRDTPTCALFAASFPTDLRSPSVKP